MFIRVLNTFIDGTGQDAAKPFYSNELVEYTAEISTEKNLFLISAVTLIVVGLIVSIIAFKKDDNSKFGTFSASVAIISLFALLFGFTFSSSNLRREDGLTKTVSFAGKFFGQDKYIKPNEEFKLWAKERYGLDLTDNQSSILRTKSSGLGESSFSNETFIDGKFIKSWIENGQINLMEADNQKREIATVFQK